MMMSDDDTEPRGELAIRTQAIPKDTNPNGDIFGGWLMGHMDVAGGVTAAVRAKGRIATVAIKAMTFHRPVKVGDILCCYCHVERIGMTSLTVLIEAWVLKGRADPKRVKVTEGEFIYVALDEDGNKRKVPTS
jgi:acyl-CoA thioesterase YciA